MNDIYHGTETIFPLDIFSAPLVKSVELMATESWLYVFIYDKSLLSVIKNTVELIQGLKNLGHLSLPRHIGRELDQVEQLEFKLALMWIASVAGGRLTCCSNFAALEYIV